MPHTLAHVSMEDFWQQFRPGVSRFAEKPTNIEYSRALLHSLLHAGLSKEEAMTLVRKAARERNQRGLIGGMGIPAIPNAIRNLAS